MMIVRHHTDDEKVLLSPRELSKIETYERVRALNNSFCNQVWFIGRTFFFKYFIEY